MNLRYQLSLYFISVSLAAFSAASFLIINGAVADKKNYISEINSYVAPQAQRSIDDKLSVLLNDLQTLKSLQLSSKKQSSIELQLILKKLRSQHQYLQAVLIYENESEALALPINIKEEKISELQSSLQKISQLNRKVYHIGRITFLGDNLYAAAFTEGVIFFTLDSAQLFAPAFELTRGKKTALYAHKQGLIAGNDKEDLLNQLLPLVPAQVWSNPELVSTEVRDVQKRRQYLLSFARSATLDEASVIVLSAQPAALDMILPIVKPYLGLLVLLVLLAAYLAYMISKKIAHPIEDLAQLTKEVGLGNWKTVQINKQFPETRNLAVAFNKMIKNLSQREQQLQQTQTKLIHSESLAAIGRLSAGIAHEVKNPLGSILGYAQLIDMKLKNPHELMAQPQLLEAALNKIKEYTLLLMDDTRRAGKIITDLLTFSRQEKVQLQNLKIDDFIKTNEPKLQALCESVQIKFEIRSERDTKNVQISADPDKLYQVVFNFVQNAVHALKSHTNENKLIQIQIMREDANVCISVIDNGPGIAPENLKKIFEPFFSTKKAGEGTGLGLALCYGIIQLHNGSIEVDSVMNKQTCFKIRIPAV